MPLSLKTYRWIAGIGASLTVLATVGAYFWLHHHSPQDAYYGIAFGDGKPEVEYKLGVPQYVEAPRGTTGIYKGVSRLYYVSASADDKNALPPGEAFGTFNVWNYDNPHQSVGYLSIQFSNKSHKVNEIACYSASKSPTSCSAVLGIHVNDTEDYVRRVLGTPDDETLEGTTKTVLYRKLNVTFIFEKQRVYMIKVGQYQRL